MVDFIREFAIDLLRRMRALESDGILDRASELADQLSQLDPRDFVPEYRCRFLEARLGLRRWVGHHLEESRVRATMCDSIDPVSSIQRTASFFSSKETKASQWARISDAIRKQQELPKVDRPPDDLVSRCAALTRPPIVLPDGDSSRRHEYQQYRRWVEYEKVQRDGADAAPEFDAVLQTIEEVVAVLDCYEGLGGLQSPRSFLFVRDERLRELVRRDYRELHLKLFPSRAWKSVVALSGSILEAVLWDQLSVDETKARRVATTLPRLDGTEVGRGQPLKDWFLAELIEVACSQEIGLLPTEQKNLIHRSLRKHRNLIHPRQEIKENLECTEAVAGLAKHALDHICDHLAARAV